MFPQRSLVARCSGEERRHTSLLGCGRSRETLRDEITMSSGVVLMRIDIMHSDAFRRRCGTEDKNRDSFGHLLGGSRCPTACFDGSGCCVASNRETGIGTPPAIATASRSSISTQASASTPCRAVLPHTICISLSSVMLSKMHVSLTFNGTKGSSSKSSPVLNNLNLVPVLVPGCMMVSTVSGRGIQLVLNRTSESGKSVW